MCSKITFGLGYLPSLKTIRTVITLKMLIWGVALLPGQDLADKGDNTLMENISDPWYSGFWAYLLFGLLAIGLLYLVYWRQERKMVHQKQWLKEKEEVVQGLRAAQGEQEKLQQRYHLLEEQLEGVKRQLRSKTIALAKKTKKNDEKGRILRILKEEVDAITKQNDSIKFKWREVSRILGRFQEEEDNNFSVLIEELHQDFLTRLSEQYPDLTTYDLRLCVYLKTGLTTREMAEMMSVLPSSVNVSRSRLRKKLNLEPKEDLFKFLKKFA